MSIQTIVTETQNRLQLEIDRALIDAIRKTTGLPELPDRAGTDTLIRELVLRGLLARGSNGELRLFWDASLICQVGPMTWRRETIETFDGTETELVLEQAVWFGDPQDPPGLDTLTDRTPDRRIRVVFTLGTQEAPK